MLQYTYLLVLWTSFLCIRLESSSGQSLSSPQPSFSSPHDPHSQPTGFGPQTSPQPRPPDIYTQGEGLTVGGTSREGELSPGAVVQLPTSVWPRRYTSLSVRTCAPGPLLTQQGADGDLLLLEVTDHGGARLTLTRLGASHVVTAEEVHLLDNEWHHVFLRFELGALTLGVDDTTTGVADAAGPAAHFLELNLWSPQPVLTVGGGAFSGCVSEGAGVRLSQDLTRHTGVQWGRCSLPDGRNCSGYDTDPCFSNPCGGRGVCVASNEGTSCHCYARYQGPTCAHDTGPLCHQGGGLGPCTGRGLCEEDWQGNGTHCSCSPGFVGLHCERSILVGCPHNPCLNGGQCESTEFGGGPVRCHCAAGVTGDRCEHRHDECAPAPGPAPCLHGGVCTSLNNGFHCDCAGTGYRGSTCAVNIDECSEGASCAEGATCLDLYGGYECLCPSGYHGLRCDEVLPACASNPCQNAGVCEAVDESSGALGRYTCHCPLGFEGDSCENDIDDCLGVTCPDSDSFCVDGVNSFTCACNPGTSGTPPNCVRIDECASNPCLHGATCFDEISNFTCICQPGYRGLVCEENIDECSGAPCLNGGSCVDGVATFVCACPPGYDGDTCQQNIDECALNLCQHAQNCTDTLGGYECVCQPGWEGTQCNEDINECLSTPCHHGAFCTDRINSFHCACPPGYTGPTCETDMDECAGVTCLNGGTCHDGINNYTCVCLPAYTGLHCAERYDACSSQPCQNSGHCYTLGQDGVGEPGYYCECLAGFEGLLCSNNLNDCIDVTCPEGRICIDGVNMYECQCPAGYSGAHCLDDIDECSSSPCHHGGTCYDGIANYTCDCPQGLSGHNCEEDVNECDLNSNLCNNGICENNAGSYQCYCRPGFSGDHCNLEFDECLSHPCRNNASCVNEINGYHCICQPGFMGTDCELEIDECEVVPCRNGATCVDLIAAFSCVCVPGYTDQLCATNIDECESNPCLNGGGCDDGINSFACNCSDTGFKGDQCEQNIDDCDPLPCQHDSNCTDLIKDYHCTCHDGYQGKNCEVDVPECAAMPCQFGGTCLERSNRTLYDEGLFSGEFSYTHAGGFQCVCVPGYTGSQCEINIDECEDAPCVHGTCIDGVNAYSCECHAGYAGTDCETELDECELFTPCVHGTCQDMIADYQCTCHAGYGGKNCSVELLGCLDVECLHGGVCEPLLEDEVHHDFRCDCEPGFTGTHCADMTTFSLTGDSYIMVNSKFVEGYSLEFWFRSTLPAAVLAVGQGETYYSLELRDGRLNLHSSLLNQYEGIFTEEGLNTGSWQHVRLLINDTHVLLAGGHDSIEHPIEPIHNHTSFTTTVLGGATSTLRVLSKGAPFFTGCMQDAAVNEVTLVPGRLPSAMKVHIVEGCPRVEQCDPNPCHHEGRCQDLWSDYHCHCQRPHLGRTCLHSFTAATFGNEAVRDSLVTVVIPPSDAAMFRSRLDVSLLLRTRQPEGLVFYLGTHLNNTEGSFVVCSLVDGRVRVKVLLDTRLDTFTLDHPQLHDGRPHLLQVIRDGASLHVFIDGVAQLNATLTAAPTAVTVAATAAATAAAPFIAEVMYLGGLPPTTLHHPALLPERAALLLRKRRQLGTRNHNTDNNAIIDDNNFNNDNSDNSNFNNDNIHNLNFGANNEDINFHTTNHGEVNFNNNFSNDRNFNNNENINFGTVNTNFGNGNINFDDNNHGATFNNDNIDRSTSIFNVDRQQPPFSSQPEFDLFSPQTFPSTDNFESSSPSTDFFSSSSVSSPTFSSFPTSSPSFSSSSPSSFPSSTPSFDDPTTPRQQLEPAGPVHFKGIIQDIRLSNGTTTRLVQPFLLRPVEGENYTLPGSTLTNTILHNVLEGTVSDAACRPEPCYNNASCAVTWNDYECTCTFGFKGKDCNELEYCALHSCPAESHECKNLLDGYECLALLTLNGRNSSYSYRAVITAPPELLNTIAVNYRSKVGGILFWVGHGLSSVWVGLAPTGNSDDDSGGAQVVVQQSNASQGVVTSHYDTPTALDGSWHQLNVTFDVHQGILVAIDNTTLVSSGQPATVVVVDFRGIVLHGDIRLGAGPEVMLGENLINEDYLLDNSPPRHNPTPPPTPPPYFRGCFGDVRIQDVLLPAFLPELLANNTAANTFSLVSAPNSELGCRVCYGHECVNGGHCERPADTYSCSCVAGFRGEHCEENIDDCPANLCENGALCVDGIDRYTCECSPGYMGQICETEINECAPAPCLHGGVCTDGIATFFCECTEEYTGATCADLKINNCTSNKCTNGAHCTDLYTSVDSQLNRVADNYSCACMFGYAGRDCEVVVQYCTLEGIQCVRGACDLTFVHPGWRCECEAGYEGLHCEREVDECVPNPCLNGASCTDILRGYICYCANGWQGLTCEVDVDECAQAGVGPGPGEGPCSAGGTCLNLQGSFLCDCQLAWCGQTCSLDNPCPQHECEHDGMCVAQCDEQLPAPLNNTSAFCECAVGWAGEHCAEQARTSLSTTTLAILIGALVGLFLLCAIVGLVVFLMMAKKKRATRGTYSPSRQEYYSPRVEMDAMMKPPPEERLI